MHTIIEAVRQLPDLPLVLKIFGNAAQFPNYTSDLKKRVKNDDRIQFLGVYDRKDISQVFSNLDLLVVPSLWYENSPNVILEAFAHHVPVLASDLGGMAELVENGKNGALFKAGNASDLKRLIRTIAENPIKICQYQDFIPAVKTVDQEIEEVLNVYNRVIHSKVPA